MAGQESTISINVGDLGSAIAVAIQQARGQSQPVNSQSTSFNHADGSTPQSQESFGEGSGPSTSRRSIG